MESTVPDGSREMSSLALLRSGEPQLIRQELQRLAEVPFLVPSSLSVGHKDRFMQLYEGEYRTNPALMILISHHPYPGLFPCYLDILAHVVTEASGEERQYAALGYLVRTVELWVTTDKNLYGEPIRDFLVRLASNPQFRLQSLILSARLFGDAGDPWSLVADEYIRESQSLSHDRPTVPNSLPEVMRDDLLSPQELDLVNRRLKARGFPPVPTEAEVAEASHDYLRRLRTDRGDRTEKGIAPSKPGKGG